MILTGSKRLYPVKPISKTYRSLEVLVEDQYGSTKKTTCGVWPALQRYTDLIRHIFIGSCQHLKGKVGRFAPVNGRSGKSVWFSHVSPCMVLP